MEIPLRFGRRGCPVGVGWIRPVNQHEIAEIHETSDALSGNEDRISPIDRVGKRNHAADQTHIPEGGGHAALCVAFRCDPLDDPAHKEYPLPQEPDKQPQRVESHSGTEDGVDGDEVVEAVRYW
ncbi:MAG: hypothetical protein K0S45_840 [Nitrospira sp.]|nr:hypothetical protein [Nitrospira sp.]